MKQKAWRKRLAEDVEANFECYAAIFYVAGCVLTACALAGAAWLVGRWAN